MPENKALETAIAAFKDEFVPSEGVAAGIAADEIEVGDAVVSRVQDEVHLPEDEIARTETEA